MTAAAITPGDERRNWSIAGSLAVAGHLAVATLVLAWARQPQAPVPEPVVLIELPAAAAAPASSPDQPAEPQQMPMPTPSLQTPPVDVPPMRTPPANAVTLPPSAPPQPQRQAAASAPAPTAPLPAAPSAAGASNAAGNDPRAKKQEADYFAMVSAHLNRRKAYPVEARQARQQGVVVVRFTVDRNGNVSGVSIKRSSGHGTLDSATLALVQRVAPLPRMPASMQRDSLTLSLPIDYSLRTI